MKSILFAVILTLSSVLSTNLFAQTPLYVIKERNEQIVKPTQRIETQFSYGASVVINFNNKNYIVSCNHVVEDPPANATIVARHETEDLIILSGDDTKPSTSITEIELIPGEDVWVSGAALNTPVHITYGLLSVVDLETPRGLRHVVSAPTHPGNSGGGAWVFRDGKYHLIGIVQAIAVYGPAKFSTFAYIIPIETVKTFIEKNAR